MDMTFIDGNGVEFKVGTRVIVGDPQDAESYGRVRQISDPDGDVDDEGRPVYYPPRVTVQFEGFEDVFICHSTASGPWDEDAPFACDDLEVDTRMLPALTNCDPGDETKVAA